MYVYVHVLKELSLISSRSRGAMGVGTCPLKNFVRGGHQGGTSLCMHSRQKSVHTSTYIQYIQCTCTYIQEQMYALCTFWPSVHIQYALPQTVVLTYVYIVKQLSSLIYMYMYMHNNYYVSMYVSECCQLV